MTDEGQAERLRRKLVEDLTAAGRLGSGVWRAAVASVPRHLFVPSFFRPTDGPRGTVWAPIGSEEPSWLEEVYADRTLVTQLDGSARPESVDGPVPGDPTSSSTLPSLVVRMLEDLDLHDGDRVLEVGTGTGYSTALMCHRLGSEHVTSIEYDAIAAGRARAALHAAGYRPTLVAGDGLEGCQEGAPYDRLVATCSVRGVPRAWLGQVRPGGTILATLSGWLHGSGLVRLTVGEDGTAEGGFLPGTVSFMIARQHAAPRLTDRSVILGQPAEERTARFGPGVLHDWTPQFIAQLAAPTAQYLGMSTDGGPMLDYLVDGPGNSFAELRPAAAAPEGWTVRQGGTGRLWDRVEAALDAWQRAGSPPQSSFAVTITGDGAQSVALPDGTSWQLPGEAGAP